MNLTGNVMLIPDRVIVGFKKREKTINGVLGFVVAKDGDKIPWQRSFDSWRDNNLDTIEFDNTPYDQFSIVRGHKRTSWSHFGNRSTSVIRIYDERGVEFEIDINNFTSIVQNYDIVDQKILGKFVYAFGNSKMSLIPIESEEYTKAKNATALSKGKVRKRDLVIGRTYIFKDSTQGIYLGDIPIYEWVEEEKLYNESGTYYHTVRSLYGKREARRLQPKKKITFAVLSEGAGTVQYRVEQNVTKLAKEKDDKIHQDIDKLIKNRMKMFEVNPVTSFKVLKKTLSLEDVKKIKRYSKEILINEIEPNTGSRFAAKIARLYPKRPLQNKITIELITFGSQYFDLLENGEILKQTIYTKHHTESFTEDNFEPIEVFEVEHKR